MVLFFPRPTVHCNQNDDKMLLQSTVSFCLSGKDVYHPFHLLHLKEALKSKCWENSSCSMAVFETEQPGNESVQWEPTGWTTYFQFISIINLYIFPTGLLLIIRRYYSVYTTVGVYVDWLLAGSEWILPAASQNKHMT